MSRTLVTVSRIANAPNSLHGREFCAVPATLSATGTIRLRQWQPILLLAMVCLCFAAAQGAEPASPPLPPGMVLTTPVISEEIPEVLRELHKRLSKGIAPKDNAAVWLLHIYGDGALDAPLHDVTLEMLGIETMSPASPLFVSIDEFVRSQGHASPEEAAREGLLIDQQLQAAGQELWTAAQSPQLASYLKANENALKTLTIAADCPSYFAPLLAPELPSRLLSVSLVIERRLPFLCRLLAVRALLRFSERNLSGCLEDLTSIHKLAVLLANGSPFDVSVAKGQVMDSIAFQAERALLESGQLTRDDLHAFQTSVAAYPAFPPAWKAADVGERAIIQQELMLLKTDKDSKTGFFEESEHERVDPEQMRSLDEVSWSLAQQEANRIQDQVVAALKIKDRSEQLARFRELDSAYALWEATVDVKTAKFSMQLKKDLPGMSRWVGENMAMSLRPNYYQRRASEDRMDVRRDLIVAGIALEMKCRENGEFPAALADLVPSVFPAVPRDACTDAPFVYQHPTSTQARLMSLGTNRVDDAGQNYNDDVELKLH